MSLKKKINLVNKILQAPFIPTNGFKIYSTTPAKQIILSKFKNIKITKFPVTGILDDLRKTSNASSEPSVEA